MLLLHVVIAQHRNPPSVKSNKTNNYINKIKTIEHIHTKEICKKYTKITLTMKCYTPHRKWNPDVHYGGRNKLRDKTAALQSSSTERPVLPPTSE